MKTKRTYPGGLGNLGEADFGLIQRPSHSAPPMANQIYIIWFLDLNVSVIWFRGFPPKPSVGVSLSGGWVAIIFPDRVPCLDMKHKWIVLNSDFFGRVNPGVLQMGNIPRCFCCEKIRSLSFLTTICTHIKVPWLCSLQYCRQTTKHCCKSASKECSICKVEMGCRCGMGT